MKLIYSSKLLADLQNLRGKSLTASKAQLLSRQKPTSLLDHYSIVTSLQRQGSPSSTSPISRVSSPTENTPNTQKLFSPFLRTPQL